MSIAITTILGTARADNQSAKVATWVQAKLQAGGRLIQAGEMGQVNTIPPEVEDQTADHWRAVAQNSDGFIIISPEYNHGYPGELKLLLDSAYSEYEKKPVGLIGVSAGRLGGARVVEQLRLVTLALKMTPLPTALHIGPVSEAFDEAGRLSRSEYESTLDAMIEQLHRLGQTLKENRSQS